MELVERMIDAWNNRDEELMLANIDPEFEYVNPPMAIEPGVRHGPDGLLTVARAQWEALGEDARQRIDEVHVVGERVVTAGRAWRTMPGSDTPLENRVVLRWTFRGDRIHRLEMLGGGSEFNRALDRALAETAR